MKLRSALIKLYSDLFGKCTRLVSDKTYVRTLYFLSFGRFPSLKHPKLFSEHICAIKLSDKSLRYSDYTDKFAVRSYVEKTIGKEYLTPALGVYNSFDEIPLDSFPERFALKATHASGYNVIVKNKARMDREACRQMFSKWLSVNYYTVGREKNYKNVPPRILAEEYLQFSEPLTEYKLFCFYGEVKMISVNRATATGRRVTVYTPQWEQMDMTFGYKSEPALKKPECLKELLLCAQKLAAPFDFVRVDLYAQNDCIRFSELTFTPGGGLQHIRPKKYDKTIGEWFERKS